MHAKLYRTLFVGTLDQESFSSVGGAEDPFTTVDSPFCRDGQGRPTLRGSGLAGALVATLRRLRGSVPKEISGSKDGRVPSVWRFFNSHCRKDIAPAFRQHVAIDPRTGAAAEGALFNAETLPPGTSWPFLLEVDTSRDPTAADRAREALAHWAAGRCLIGGEVARGLGWMRLGDDLREHTLTAEHCDLWPNSEFAADYASYIAKYFGAGHSLKPAADAMPGWREYACCIQVGPREDGYGIDSLSIGGHASEELAAAWEEGCESKVRETERFLDRDERFTLNRSKVFDPDFAVVTMERNGKRVPYIPGSSLRGPLRHALARLLKARGQDTALATSLFGDVDQSAKLLISDGLPVENAGMRLAWMQHHAEDEFAGGACGSSKFDRVAVMEGTFAFRMVLEYTTEAERVALEDALKEVLELAQAGQIGIGGAQWRGHGWPQWQWKETASPTEMRT